jgi:hypothetical protein
MLRSDMAKRIMYSIIPSVSDSVQVHHTHGVVDYNALIAAAEGRHDLIKYGTRACVREINHYQKSGHTIYEELMKEHDKGNYYDIAKKAVEMFGDFPSWATSFGGKPWFNIANSLLKIVTYSDELMVTNRQKNSSADYWDKSIQIMNSIVIEMNVLDGLAHNTDSIMRNMTNEEALDRKGGASVEFDRIKKLMDAKELTNAIDVYRIVEAELIESGDIYRYKDWTKRLRNTPDYLKPKNNTEEMFRIRFRKIHMLAISKINTMIDNAKAKILSMTPEPPKPGDILVIENVNLYAWIDTITRNLSYQVSEYASKDNEVKSKIHKICQSLYDSVFSLHNKINNATSEYSDIFDNDALKIIKLNDAIHHLSSISYLMSSV